MKVHIIRHTAVDVPQHICYGQTDVPLKPTFEEEAEQVKREIADMRFEAVFCSPLSRCVKLATYCGYGDAIRDKRLLELNFGAWEWQYIYSMTQLPQVKYWFDNQLTQQTPGGESIMDMRDRLSDFIEEQKAEGLEHICLFAHGGIHLCAMLLQGETFSNDIFYSLPPYGAVREYDF